MALWYQAGVNPDKSWAYNRSIIICNWTAAIVSGISLLFGSIQWLLNGWTLSAKMGLLTTLAFLAPLELNRKNAGIVSRVWLCTAVTAGIMMMSVVDKIEAIVPSDFQYFSFRILLIGASLLPFLVFRLAERRAWIGVTALNFVGIFLYDIIHNLFSVGYYDVGFSGPYYVLVNIMFIVAFAVVVGGTYYLKGSFESFEMKNERLIARLFDTNNQLAKQNKRIAHHEDELMKANQLIREQRELLARENEQLNKELVNKNLQLMNSNRELTRHNNELTQFSYTVSHNLKGPVASLLGLIGLLSGSTKPKEQIEILRHIRSAVESLDSTIQDLNNIIDFRHTVSHFKHVVYFYEEALKIEALLKKTLDDNEVMLKMNFSAAPEILSVRAMVHSIMYNLISNAVKYRSTKRKPQIVVKSVKDGDFIRLDVEDNGIGFDVSSNADKVFGLYKRFHSHIEGKGMGLFLVKLQAEALNGRVEVKSIPDKGTVFSVYMRVPTIVPEHSLLDEDDVSLSYDAMLNCITCKCRSLVMNPGKISGAASDFMRNYKVPSLIVDISEPMSSLESLLDFCGDLCVTLSESGLRRLCLVVPSFPADEKVIARALVGIRSAHGVETEVHSTYERAAGCVRNENQKDRAKYTVATEFES